MVNLIRVMSVRRRKRETNHTRNVVLPTRPPITAQLYRACTIGDANLFNLALEELTEGYELSDMASPQENSVLHIAASFGHDMIVQLIVEECPSIITKRNSNGDTALHIAARYGHLSIVCFMINCAKNNVQYDLEEGNIQEVRGLLSMINVDGNTALHEAIINGHQAVSLALINADAELVDVANNKGESSFYLAAEVGIEDVVQKLLEAPIDPLLQEIREGKTALHAAIKQGHTGIIELLVEIKPELVELRDSRQRSPLHYAMDSGSLQAVNRLLKSDASSARQPDDDGTFPIHKAASKGQVSIFQKILHHCPDSRELLDLKGRNALHAAVKSRQVHMVKYILKSLDLEKLINEKDVEGNTPLHLSTFEGHAMTVNILVSDKRVSTIAVNNEGLTPYDTADLYAASESSFQKVLIMMALRSAHSPRCHNHRENTIEDVNDQGKKTSTKSFKDRINTLLLVSTLIVTVTFAAGFTMPGGYNNDDPDKGMATMLRQVTFHIFVISNTIAMYSSIIAAITLTWAHLGDVHLLERAMRLSMVLLAIALTMMALAFGAGVNLAVRKLWWLASVLLVIDFIFLLCILVLFIPLQLPLVSKYRWMQFLHTFTLRLLLFASSTLSLPMHPCHLHLKYLVFFIVVVATVVIGSDLL